MKTAMLATIILLSACTDPNVANDYHNETALGVPDPCKFDWLTACVEIPEYRDRRECLPYRELWAEHDMANPDLVKSPTLPTILR